MYWSLMKKCYCFFPSRHIIQTSKGSHFVYALSRKQKQLKFQRGDGSIFTALLHLTLLGLQNVKAASVKREHMNKSWLELSRKRLRQDQPNEKVIATLQREWSSVYHLTWQRGSWILGSWSIVKYPCPDILYFSTFSEQWHLFLPGMITSCFCWFLWCVI